MLFHFGERERGTEKTCGKWHWSLCFSRRPVGRRKCGGEVGEAGTKPKKLRAVIMKVGKKKGM